MAKEVFGTKEWSDSSANFITGCSNDCHYCLDGETLILMYNGLTKKLKNIEIGDEVYGVKKDGVYWKYGVSKVTNKWIVDKPSYKITLENGTELIASADHRFLSDRNGWKYVKGDMAGPGRRPYLTSKNKLLGFGSLTDSDQYKETDLYKKGYLSGMIEGDANLNVYDCSSERRSNDIQYRFRLAIIDIEGVERTEQYLKYFGVDVSRFNFPMKRRNGNIENTIAIRTSKKADYHAIKKLILHQTGKEFLRGYLAGIFDAEGNGSGANRNIKRISNSDPKIIEMIEAGMKAHGFSYVFDKDKTMPSGKILRTIRIKGGHREFMKFYQTTQTAIKRHFDITGGSVKTFSGTKIISIEKYKESQKLYDITTSSENFIANGIVSHNCYAKSMAIRFKRATVDSWATPIIREAQLEKKIGKKKGTIMFPSTHDLHPEHLCYIIPFLEKLLSPGNDVLIVSKPHQEVIRVICESFPQYRKQILFRFTIGSGYNRILKFWEPGAPTFEERGSALVHAFDNGFETSISCEPMLDEYIGDVIHSLRKFVTDSIWLGKMNDPTSRLKINGHSSIPAKFKDGIRYWMNDENIFNLYERYHDDPLIKWKESIKKVIGLKMPEEKGLDV